MSTDVFRSAERIGASTSTFAAVNTSRPPTHRPFIGITPSMCSLIGRAEAAPKTEVGIIKHTVPFFLTILSEASRNSALSSTYWVAKFPYLCFNFCARFLWRVVRDLSWPKNGGFPMITSKLFTQLVGGLINGSTHTRPSKLTTVVPLSHDQSCIDNFATSTLTVSISAPAVCFAIDSTLCPKCNLFSAAAMRKTPPPLAGSHTD